MYGMEHGGGWNKTHGRVDKHLCLDSFAILKDWPESKTASITWPGGASIAGRLDEDQFTLAYAPKGGEPVKQAINLSRIRNGYGGRPRTHFICPYCGKRVQKLYFAQRRFRCRVCANLNYYTQQVTHNDDAAAWRMERIFRKDFGVKGELIPMDMCHWLPEKPKGMHWKTYWKKAHKLQRAQHEYNRVFAAQVGKIMGKGWR